MAVTHHRVPIKLGQRLLVVALEAEFHRPDLKGTSASSGGSAQVVGAGAAWTGTFPSRTRFAHPRARAASSRLYPATGLPLLASSPVASDWPAEESERESVGAAK